MLATLYPPGRFLVLISLRGCIDPRAIVQLEGLGKLKKSSDLIGNFIDGSETNLYSSTCEIF
jgi:hypothetical protein